MTTALLHKFGETMEEKTWKWLYGWSCKEGLTGHCLYRARTCQCSELSVEYWLSLDRHTILILNNFGWKLAASLLEHGMSSSNDWNGYITWTDSMQHISGSFNSCSWMQLTKTVVISRIIGMQSQYTHGRHNTRVLMYVAFASYSEHR